jgi:HSP20 family protein
MEVIVRFDPFQEFDSMVRQMQAPVNGTTRFPRVMPMDLFRAGDHYVLNADLPGIDPGSVDVSVDNGVLTLRAHRSLPSEDGVQWITSERASGTYMRHISLGDGIAADKIAATYENGVLSVTIPLAERAKPRRIEVATASRKSGQKAVTASVGRTAR